MFLKRIIAIVLCTALLLIVSTLAIAKGGGQGINQAGMETPTLMVESQPTPFPDLPLSGAQTDMGTCSMMSAGGMTTDTMSGMSAGGMTGMSGMSGMQGTSGMNMGTMSGVNMAGMDDPMMNYYATPWYSNPWLLLGWVLLALIVVAILIGIVFGVRLIMRRSKPNHPVDIS